MDNGHLIFHGAELPHWLSISGTVCVAACVLIWMLLRYERRLVPPFVGFSLLLLRLAVVAAILLILMEPVLTWTVENKHTSRILVMVDASASMNTADTHANKAERLRWARALGMVGNAATNERLDRWIQAFEAGKTPVWVDESEAADDETRRELADVRQENLQGVLAEIDRLSRKEIASRLLTKTTKPLLMRLEQIAPVDLRVFAGRSEATEAAGLEKALVEPSEMLQPGRSDLTQAFAAVGDEQDASLAGIVILTDGRDTSRRDPLNAAKRLRELSVPVAAVLMGSETRPKDLAVTSIDAPLSVYKDDRPLVRVTLRTSGYVGEKIAVSLKRVRSETEQNTAPTNSDQEDVQEKTIVPSGLAEVIEFTLDAASTGRHQYAAKVELRPDETRDDNNQESFAINVIDDSAHVLILDDSARWEFRFIDNALVRDDRVQVDHVVFSQPYLGIHPEPFFPRRVNWPADIDHWRDSPLVEPDVIIVGDVSPADIPERGWAFLERFVAEAGGTLVFCAGKQYLPWAFRSKVLDRLLPVTGVHPIDLNGNAAMTSPSERGFRLRLTPEGENEPMLQFDTDLTANAQIWSRLPGHVWAAIGKAKPGATVFAAAVSSDDPTLSAERDTPIIVHQHYGGGQVLWIGIDSTWRWRYRVGDTFHHRFWGQLARWAAQDKAAAGNEFVRFGPERTDIDAGTQVVLRARWTQDFLKKHPDLKAVAEVERVIDGNEKEPFATIELKPNEARPFVHEGILIAPPAGEYNARLTVEGATLGAKTIEAPLFVHALKTPELSDVSANRQLLSQVAEAAGGRLFLPDELDEILELFQPTDTTTSTRKEIPLWDHWLVLTLLFALLTAEWVIRKLNGLP